MVCPYDNHVWHVWARPKGTRTKYCPRHVRERKVECAAGHIWIWKFDADKVGRSPPKWCPEHLKEGRLASIRAANARPRARSPFLTGDELRKEIHRQLFETLLTLPTSEAFQAGTPESRMLEGIRMKCVDYECKHDHLPSDNNITCNCWSHEWIAWARRYAL